MSLTKLHPNVEEFKLFINAHPELVLELRRSGGSLQDYYNKWVEYGEDDSVWGIDKGKGQEKDKDKDYRDLINQIVKYAENIDVNKIQGHVKKFNKVLDTVQLMLGNFIGQDNTNTDFSKQTDLFNLFRD